MYMYPTYGRKDLWIMVYPNTSPALIYSHGGIKLSFWIEWVAYQSIDHRIYL